MDTSDLETMSQKQIKDNISKFKVSDKSTAELLLIRESIDRKYNRMVSSGNTNTNKISQLKTVYFVIGKHIGV